jgi:DNA-binding NarL/FixJ family response regulator
MALRHCVGSEDICRLLDALACYWRFADVVRAIADEAPALAPQAIQSATRHSSSSNLQDAIKAVRGLHSGKLSDAIERAYRERDLVGADSLQPLSELTHREMEILSLMAIGKRNGEMASQLFISLPTVKTHVNHIYAKLGVGTRVEAVLAYKHGMLDH